ncbi:MAG: ATPase, T2SS/T4P/T4SS family [Actinomycetaceae bacterium]|nr:ATPase, T2SS/T4P/T4SS family [Actinomycetaceae bacterium]
MQYQSALAQVRGKVAEAGIDPTTGTEEIRKIIDTALINMNPDEAAELSRRLLDTICGLGPLQPLLEDDKVEEIWIDSPSRVFVAKDGQTELTTIMLGEGEVQELVERMLRFSGRRLDLSSPFVDAQLPGGERLHAVIPPVAATNWAVNIRKHVAKARRLPALVSLGMLPEGAASFLEAAVASGLNILVSGAVGAGKTTMLRALAGAIPASNRVVTCEEVFELDLQARDVVAMQTRPPNLDGSGEVTLRHLVKESLRMRPNNLIIGEVRSAEALDLLIALNAGIPGMCTIHANSAKDALAKLTILPLLAGPNVTAAFVTPTVATALDLVVHVEKDRRGHRHVSQILGITGRVEAGVVEAASLFEWRDSRLVRGNGALDAHDRFAAAGFDITRLLARTM